MLTWKPHDTANSQAPSTHLAVGVVKVHRQLVGRDALQHRLQQLVRGPRRARADRVSQRYLIAAHLEEALGHMQHLCKCRIDSATLRNQYCGTDARKVVDSLPTDENKLKVALIPFQALRLLHRGSPEHTTHNREL
jgi:hypothetical protein